MSKRKLPMGEETLPIAIIEGKMLTPLQLKEHPAEFGLLVKGERPRFMAITDDLLIERVRQRYAQGREATIYRFVADGMKEIFPEDQIVEMEQRSVLGLEFIKAERKLVEEELRIISEAGDV